MKYLVVNPYGPAYGIAAYSQHIADLLKDRVDTDYIGNDNGMSWEHFRDRVADYVTRTYRPSEVVLEAPEARSATLRLPKEYRVHIRLHSVGGVGQLGNAWKLDPDRLDRELDVIRHAAVVSSSAHAILRLMKTLIDTETVHVFKNPADHSIPFAPFDQKDIDVFFMGRLERLKGMDLLKTLLERLPASFSASLVGPGVEAFEPPKGMQCGLEFGPAIYDRSRFRLLGRSKVFLMLSRFENCSLAVLEALAAGTVVVGWDVGGNSEIAPPPVMRLVPFGDVDALTEVVMETVAGDYPRPEAFRAATDALISDFDSGWSAVWRQLSNGAPTAATYTGLSERAAHLAIDPTLAGGPKLLPVRRAYAEAKAALLHVQGLDRASP